MLGLSPRYSHHHRPSGPDVALQYENYQFLPSTLSVLVAALLITGCGIAQQPRPADDIDVQWDIQDPTRTSPHAELFITDSGYWGYSPTERSEFEPEFGVGEIVTLDADGYDHLFVVVQQEPWGYRFERLDDRPIESKATGQLRRLSDRDIAERPDLCIIEDPDSTAEHCGHSHRHRRWHLYDLGAEYDQEPLTLTTRPIDGDRAGHSVRPQAVVGSDGLSSWVESDAPFQPGHRALAIEAEPRTQAHLRPRLVFDETCSEIPESTALVETVVADFDLAGVQLESDAHPVTIEDASMRLGADAFVTCRHDQPHLAVPMLTRPFLSDDDGRLLAPWSMGLEMRNLGELSPSTAAAWSRAAALGAVGDNAGSAFWISRAIDGDSTDDSEQMALASMPLLATGGQPELALRIGSTLTGSAWNPENNPDYLDGLIALFAVVDEAQTLRDRMEHRQGLLERHYNHRSGWQRWYELRIELSERRGSHGPAYRDVIADLQDDDLDGWALAVWALLQSHNLTLPIVDDPAELDGRFSEIDAHHLWSVLRGSALEQWAPTCASDPGDAACAPSSYGWIPTDDIAGEQRVIDALSNTASTTVRHGYSEATRGQPFRQFESPRQTAAYWIALSPLVDEALLPSVTEAAITGLREAFEEDNRSLCDRRDQWKARFENAAARSDVREAGTTRRQWIGFLDWWTLHGIDGLCGDIDDLFEALALHATDSDYWRADVLSLLETKFLEESTETGGFDDLQRAAELAHSLGDDRACVRWNLALVVGAARTARFDMASDHLNEASRCLSSDDPLAEAHRFVTAYLEFERGAGRSVVRDAVTEDAIDRATRRQVDTEFCVGLEPIGFRLEEQLPAAVMRIVDQLAIEPGPPEEFGLRTASTVVGQARAAYLAGIRDLQRGQPRPAARALQDARLHFAHIRHLPGLVRVEFIDDVIFDGQLHEWADGDSDAEFDDVDTDDPLTQLRSGGAHRVAADGADSTESFSDEDIAHLVAALLIGGRDGDIALLIDDYDRLPDRLCQAPAAARSGEPSAPIIIGDDADDAGE